MDTPNVEPRRHAWIMEMLPCYANGLACRYGSKVYLVGSALWSDVPRDYDIRVDLNGHDFNLLFGDRQAGNAYHRLDEDGVLTYGEVQWRQAYAELKHSRFLSSALQANVDMKFIHPWDRKVYLREGHYRRLDRAPEWFFNAGKRSYETDVSPFKGIW